VQEAGEEDARASDGCIGASPIEKTGEGAAPLTKRMFLKQRVLRNDEQIILSLLKKGALVEIQDIPHLDSLVQHETEEDLDIMSHEKKIDVIIPGLLPATKYTFSVEAKLVGYPYIPPTASLSAVLETPGGNAPPAPPMPLPYSTVAPANVGSTRRVVFLEIEDRPDYVLECMGAPLEADRGWYPIQRQEEREKTPRRDRKTIDSITEDRSLRWWTSGGDEPEAIGDWRVVPSRRVEHGVARFGFVNVMVELPEFGSATGSARFNAELSDILWFRLRVADRDTSHPCRWIGNVTDPIAPCIAPLAAPPFILREFEDDSWHVMVTFFAHTTSRPQGMAAGEARKGILGDGVFNRFMDDDEEPPAFDDRRDTSDECEGLEIPVGYGHRKLSCAQARVKLVGAVTPSGDIASFQNLPRDWVELKELLISHCKTVAPGSFRGAIAEKIGDVYRMKLVGRDALREGGIYQLQLRVGDGFRWSPWSASSKRFTYGVPQPHPVDGTVGVETLSANSVRLRWPGFRVPNTLCDVEYLLHAAPTWNATTAQGVRPVYETYVFPIESQGEMHEAELRNLLPATQYTFSVSARYPRIGWRAWSSPLSSEPQALNDNVADWSAPSAPVSVPHNGPRPFVVTTPEALPVFHPNERAFLLAFPQTSAAADGIVYQLEYKHIGFLDGDAGMGSGILPIDYRTKWHDPLEASLVMNLAEDNARILNALAAPWKAPAQLWRVRLPTMPRCESESGIPATRT
jgi:hypothetical protein